MSPNLRTWYMIIPLQHCSPRGVVTWACSALHCKRWVELLNATCTLTTSCWVNLYLNLNILYCFFKNVLYKLGYLRWQRFFDCNTDLGPTRQQRPEGRGEKQQVPEGSAACGTRRRPAPRTPKRTGTGRLALVSAELFLTCGVWSSKTEHNPSSCR